MKNIFVRLSIVMLVILSIIGSAQGQLKDGPPPTNDEATPVDKQSPPKKDIVIISLALNWADLWREGSSLEEVAQVERDEIVNEVLTEIGNKMKRRHKQPELNNFKVKKV